MAYVLKVIHYLSLIHYVGRVAIVTSASSIKAFTEYLGTLYVIFEVISTASNDYKLLFTN